MSVGSLGKSVFFVLVAIAMAMVAVYLVIMKTPEPCPQREINRFAAGDFQSAIIAAAMTPATEYPSAALADVRSLAVYGVLANLGFTVTTNSSDAADLVVRGTFPRRLPRKFRTLAILADVRDFSVADFSEKLSRLAKDHDVRLWTPTAADWLVVVTPRGVKPKLERLFELYCREKAFMDFAEAGANRASDVFASYVGGYEDFRDAFSAENLEPKVRIEFLLSHEIPVLDWLDRSGVDDRIYARFAEEARTVQVVRRLVCEGEIKGEAGNAEGAMDCWHRAYLRNPHDTLLGERLETLKRNAELLASLGNSGGAAKCLETAIVINPKDVTSIERYARLLRQLGRLELAQQVQRRVDELKAER